MPIKKLAESSIDKNTFGNSTVYSNNYCQNTLGGKKLATNISINSSSKISECKQFSCPSPNNKVSANLHYYKQGHGTNSAIL
jgi:hypothetical protein